MLKLTEARGAVTAGLGHVPFDVRRERRSLTGGEDMKESRVPFSVVVAREDKRERLAAWVLRGVRRELSHPARTPVHADRISEVHAHDLILH